jgi:YD repeat-containing protein
MTAADVYTVAGSAVGTGGYAGDGGAATSALLQGPTAIALNSSGGLVIVEAGNNVIREVVPTVTTPSGYSLVDTKSVGSTTTLVYTHAITSSDSGVTLHYAMPDPKVATLGIFRGVGITNPIDVSSDGSTSSGTSVTAPSVTTTDDGDALAFFGAAGQQGSSATWTAPSGLTSDAQVELSGISGVFAVGPGPAVAGSSGSMAASTSVSGQLTGILLALSPGSVTTTTTYNADDEPTLATDPDGNATLSCYDGDGHLAISVPPVGVAASSLSAVSCPTSYPASYGDRLATDATTTAYDALQQDDRHDTCAGGAHRFRDDDLRL